MTEIKTNADDMLLNAVIAQSVSDVVPDLIDSCGGVLRMGGDEPFFVVPTIRTVREKKTSSLVVFSAPGAVGKSTLAGYMSKEAKTYIWDLSKLKLGDNTFIGTLAKAFGVMALSTILGGLQSGKISFIFDAFDEAEILSGWDGIEKFLVEVNSFLKDADSIGAILFARSETASLLDLNLQLITGSDCHGCFEIEYFTKSQAEEFVIKQLQKLSMEHQQDYYSRYKQHPKPFIDAYNGVLSSIAREFGVAHLEMWLHRECQSFVGYAPVLVAIALWLAKAENYQEVANGVRGEGEHYGVIRSIILDLLAREQKKVVEPLRRRHQAQEAQGWCGWGTLYAPDEQLAKIFRFASTGNDVEPYLGLQEKLSLPEWLSDDYSEVVRTFLPQHPFLKEKEFSSQAFRDYVYAHAVSKGVEPSVATHLLDNPKSVPTRLFAQFLSALIGREAIPGRYAGYLCESITSGCKANEHSLTLVSAVRPGIYELAVEIQKEGDSDCINRTVYPITSTQNEPIVFSRHLRNAIVADVESVAIGGAGHSFELFNTEIRCDKLAVKAKSLVAQCHDGKSSSLSFRFLEQIDPTLQLTKRGGSDFSVISEKALPYPWASFQTDEEPKSDNDVTVDVHIIQKIFGCFRKHNRDEFAKQSEFIDNVIVGANERRRKMLEFLIKESIIFKDSKEPILYKYNLEQVQQRVGVSWSDIKTGQTPPQLKSFIQEFRTYIARQ